MNKDRIKIYTGIGLLVTTIMLSSNAINNKVEKNTKNDITTVYDNDISFSEPSGYHFEGPWKLVRNPNGLVDASVILEEGYHLEPYEYDDSLFYVIKDGYHNENGFLVPDGYYLEGSVIKKNKSLSKTR